MKAPNWEAWKLAHAYPRIGSGTTPTSTTDAYYSVEEGVPWVTTAELRENYIEKTASNVTKEALQDFSALRIYKPGSLMIAMYGATIGRLGITTMPSTCNQACCVFECSEQFDNRFLFYWLWHRRSDLIALSTGGGQPNLSQQDLREERAYCPPIETQRRIAQFLDEKTARIDGLIEKKRALLDRLSEKRQALITRAVTKGLNPDAPMKPSGIDWLGDIPAHWELLRLKHIVSEPLSYGANAVAEFDEPEWPRFVRITDVDELGRLRDETFRSLPPEIAESYLLQPNDILLARSGATVGKSFIYKKSWGIACYAGYLIRARISRQHDARFFYWFLNSTPYWEWVRSTFIQSTIQNISADRYANLIVAHPSDSAEQRQIVAFIEESCAEIDFQWDKITRSIERLEEYRAALITAAVTGKIGGLQ